MSTEFNGRIEVQVVPHYLEDQSAPDENRFAFAYTVDIVNRGGRGARLIDRHWVIVDGAGSTREVRGEGVVGEQPHLAPGQRFRYTSWVVIETPVGSMQGSYGMHDESGTRFEAPIPPFTLAVPGFLN